MSKFLLELDRIEDAPLPELLELVKQAVTDAWTLSRANVNEPQLPVLTVRGDDGKLHSMPPPPPPPGACGCPRCTLRRISEPLDLGSAN